VDYFQVRKNSRQVIRIARGPYEGLDVTRMQIWFKDRETNEYKPGRIVPFNSELIPGIIEGLVEMASEKPQVVVYQAKRAPDVLNFVQQILKAHKRPMHWEMLSEVLENEQPSIGASKWSVYNCLLSHPNLFREVDEDVFEVAKTK
jgi:hypothetical protein